jgi:phospholipid/cholesterol/gamma-HCH transport system substrate-binding protein
MFEMKKKLRWSALKSGLVVSLALLILFVVVLYAGTIRQIVTPSVELRARFQDVRGLRKGAPVWLFGTEVGAVQKIQLDPIYGLIVTFSIEKKAEYFLRSNSEAEVLTMGLLGDTYVELTPGAPEAPPLQPGELIKGTAPVGYKKVVQESAMAIEKMTALISKVQMLIAKIAEGRGTFSKLINDPTLYDSMAKSAETLQANLEEFQKSRGTLKLLLEDPALYNKLMATASSMKEWSETLNKSSGTLSKLIKDPDLYNRTLAAVSDLRELTNKLNAGQGSLGKVLLDPGLYDNLNKSAQNLDAILSSINKGQGVAGALVRDEEIVGEVKDALLEIRRLAEEMKNLLKDVKEHPGKYFKFSVF